MQGIVCGFGQVGYRVARLAVACGHEVSVVALDFREEWRDELRSQGIRFFVGDVRDERNLVQAGLNDADWVIACTSTDLTNIEVALDCKRLCPHVRTVARVFDEQLGSRLETAFGIDRIMAMSMLAAPAFAAAALGDQITGEFPWHDRRFAVVRIEIDDEHPLRGETLQAIRKRHGVATLLHVDDAGDLTVDPHGDTVVDRGHVIKLVGDPGAIRALTPDVPTASPASSGRGRSWSRMFRFLPMVWRAARPELRMLALVIAGLIAASTVVFKFGLNLSPSDAFYFVVTTVTTTGYGDISVKDAPVYLKLYACVLMFLGPLSVAILYSIVTDYVVSARLQQMASKHRPPEDGHVLVVGIGDVGFRTCEELSRLGIPLVGIDIDPEGKRATSLRGDHALILGDGREIETLDAAHWESAQAIIAATNDDAVNLSIGLLAREATSAKRVVVRMFDDRLAHKVRHSVMFDAVLSASRIAAPSFLGAAMHHGALTSFIVRQRHFTLVARAASELGEGVPLFRKPKHGPIVAIDDPSEIRPTDEVLVAVSRMLKSRAEPSDEGPLVY